MLRFIKIIAVLLVLPVSVKADPRNSADTALEMMRAEIIFSGALLDFNDNPIENSAFYHVLMMLIVDDEKFCVRRS
tara:strand:- start:349 stop:576 length:228 start_codon:yes stop_codon:yes gene_type:complete